MVYKLASINVSVILVVSTVTFLKQKMLHHNVRFLLFISMSVVSKVTTMLQQRNIS